MGKWILVVETNCVDAAREAEFNEWYDKIHLPDVLESPGFIRGTRYEFLMPWKIQGDSDTQLQITDASEKKAKFLTVYEIEADDPVEAMKASDRHVAKKAAEGRMSGLVDLSAMAIYKPISSLPEE